MKMKAVLIDRVTPAQSVKLTAIPVPAVKPGWVLVKVKAFGLNHSEKILRLSEINNRYIRHPVVPGIECVGEIADASDTDFTVGEKVCAVMGGMGRSFNGSYAEYALLPAHHVFHVDTSLSWAAFAAVPETYLTAWGSLFDCLKIEVDDTLLVRGATCALGYAAMQIANALGCRVIATTHRESKLSLLDDSVEKRLDGGKLAGELNGVTKVLDLVGPAVLKDSLSAVDEGGIVCQTGILGGIEALRDFDPIKDIPNGVYLTGYFSNSPTQAIFDDIFRFMDIHHLVPKIGAVFTFDQIKEACFTQDKGGADGKIVVTVE